jgi:Histidine kinase-, DNA gyrase B-, and HSP90-like ATPase
MAGAGPVSEARTFTIEVLGRTLEHLGTQMYKHRDAALTELIANCWDAGATWVELEIPLDAALSEDSVIKLTDNGGGMSPDQVQTDYLVLGRNRREHSDDPAGRPVMGRKGIGKLAGFGIAKQMQVITWQGDRTTDFELDVEKLRKPPGESGPMVIEGMITPQAYTDQRPTGTMLVLKGLKSRSSLGKEDLQQSLARRFSRTVRGQMEIRLNGDPVPEPEFDFESREPEGDGLSEAELSDGTKVRYWFGFSKKVLPFKVVRGFTIQTHGKTAQAPPFFFNVEATASGQHGTRYMTGIIEIDAIDDGRDADSDFISTDRQEIDWDEPRMQPLTEWGAETTRRALREWANRRGDRITKRIYDDAELSERIEALDKPSQEQLKKALNTLGQVDAEEDRSRALADSLIRAFEYRHFHDVIAEIEATEDNPEQLELLLGHFAEWKVLESRAILEIVKGRLGIVEKFGRMITEDTRETASKLDPDNLHDLIAGYPWLLNPEWQVLAEETSLTKQLQKWGTEDIPDPEDRSRYDFLAMNDEARTVVIEIKRSGHAVTLEDLQRLDRYVEKLRKGQPETIGVFIGGGDYSISDQQLEHHRSRDDFQLRTWSCIYQRTKAFYEHYSAVLEGVTTHRDFDSKRREVAKTRTVLESGSAHRGKTDRAAGLGPGAGEDRPDRKPAD